MKAKDFFENKHHDISDREFEGLHLIGNCNNCNHDDWCDIQDWNRSRNDVEITDEFGCIYWEEK